MPTYISLLDYTEQGIRDIKDSPKRLAQAKQLAKSMKGRIRQFYLTMGSHDAVAISEFPNDDAAAKFALMLGRGGAIRTETLRAFPEADYRRIINSLPK